MNTIKDNRLTVKNNPAEGFAASGQPAVNTSGSGPLLAGIILILLLFVGGGGWLYFAELSGAVIAQGVVAVKGKPKTIQHLDGGIVAAIKVSNGDIVVKNDVLVRLDDTLLKANLGIYSNRLRSATARKARLVAERDGIDKIRWDDRLLKLFELVDNPQVRSGQTNLFKARRLTLSGQASQVEEKIAQLKNQIAGAKALKQSKSRQLGLLESELSGLRELKKKGLVSNAQVLNLERQLEDLTGQNAEHDSVIAGIHNSINEAKIQILQSEREFRQSVITELREVEQEINDVSQQLYATSEQLKRVEVRAPVSGIIHEMSAYTIGGVIAPGGPILQIIPQNEAMEIEANIEPQFIDELFPGQQTTVRFSAFNQRTTPELNGTIKTISPNSVVNEQTGISFYRVTIDLTEQELAQLNGQKIVSGMPVEAFIKTHERTALSYLVKPLLDQMKHALREE